MKKKAVILLLISALVAGMSVPAMADSISSVPITTDTDVETNDSDTTRQTDEMSSDTESSYEAQADNDILQTDESGLSYASEEEPNTEQPGQSGTFGTEFQEAAIVEADTTTYTLSVKSGKDIATALNNVLASGKYQTIVIPAGSYECSQNISITQAGNITIVATGATIKAKNADVTALVSISNPKANVTIQGGTWDGNNQSLYALYAASETGYSAASITLEGCTFTNAGKNKTDTSLIESSKDDETGYVFNPKGNTFEGDGISITKAKAVTMTNVTSDNNIGRGLYVVKSRNIKISDSDFSNNGHITEYLQNRAGGQGVCFNYCTCTDDSGYAIIMKNTTVNNNGGYGIRVKSSNESPSDANKCNVSLVSIDVENNCLNGMSLNGNCVYVTDTNGKYISNGLRDDNPYWTDKTKNKRYDDFNYDDSLCAGIGAYNGSTACLNKTTCNNNNGCGATAAGTAESYSTLIAQYVIAKDNRDHGLAVRPYSNFNADSCTITGSGSNGICVCQYSKSKYITNCTVNNNGQNGSGNGISVSDHSSAKLISNCTSTNNKTDGLHVSESSTVLKVAQCTIQNNKRYGLAARNNGVVFADSATRKAISGNTTNQTTTATTKGEENGYSDGMIVTRSTTDVIKMGWDGVMSWYNIVNGKITNGPTVAKNSNGWWYIDDGGKVDFNFTGIAKNSNGYWYCKGGQVQFGVTDVLNTTYNGATGWYNIVQGKLTAGPTVAKNSNGWWYIDETGKVDFTFTGIASNSYGSWYCQGGKVQSSYSGTIKLNGTTYKIVNGKVS